MFSRRCTRKTTGNFIEKNKMNKVDRSWAPSESTADALAKALLLDGVLLDKLGPTCCICFVYFSFPYPAILPLQLWDLSFDVSKYKGLARSTHWWFKACCQHPSHPWPPQVLVTCEMGEHKERKLAKALVWACEGRQSQSTNNGCN